MNKKEIQKRVLKDGKPLALSKFSWDEKTKTFARNESSLVIDFKNINSSTIKASDSSTIDAGYYSTIKASDYSTIDAGNSSTIKASDYSTIKAGNSSTIDAGNYSTIDAGNSSTIDAGYYSTIKASYYSTIDAGNSSTIDAGYYSTIKASDYSTIKAGNSSTIDAGNSSTIDAGYYSTIKAGKECVIIRRDIFEVIQPGENEIVKLCPREIPGYLIKRGDKFYLNGDESLGEHVIIDNILSKVVSRKGNVLRVVNYGQKKRSYIVLDGDLSAHGDTIKEARESLLYKISDIDTTEFKGLDINQKRPLKEIITMYRAITGACESGVRYFVESREKVKNEYSIKEAAKITDGQYNHSKFKEFFGIREMV